VGSARRNIDGEAAGDNLAGQLPSPRTVLVLSLVSNDANGSYSGHARVFAWLLVIVQHPSGFSSEKTLTERQLMITLAILLPSSDGNRVIIGT
jgi:hypothetical protein